MTFIGEAKTVLVEADINKYSLLIGRKTWHAAEGQNEQKFRQ